MASSPEPPNSPTMPDASRIDQSVPFGQSAQSTTYRGGYCGPGRGRRCRRSQRRPQQREKLLHLVQTSVRDIDDVFVSDAELSRQEVRTCIPHVEAVNYWENVRRS